MDLAKLAAMLAPNAKPTEAMAKAMEFYVEAVLLSRELPSNADELVRRFGSSERAHERFNERFTQPFVESCEAHWRDTLELDPARDDDEARQFLAEAGLHLKTPRAVLANIHRFQCDLEASHLLLVKFRADEIAERKFSMPGGPQRDLIASCKRKKNGRTLYAIPKGLLGRLVAMAQKRRSATKRKAWRTRKEKSHETAGKSHV